MNAAATLAASSVALGTLGVVGAGSRAAAAVGVAALLDGGNAFDAAVAAALVETVTLPPKGGLAGDVVALVRQAGQSEPRALVSIGPAPAALAKACADGGLPTTGGLSVGVPGAPAGYAALAELGRLGRRRLVAPAVAMARRGVPWAPVCAALAAQADSLLTRHAPLGCRYRPADGPLAVGTRLPLPGLAALLTEFAARGAELFAGPAGTAVVERVARAGGVLDGSDLLAARAEWVDAVQVTVRGRRVWATPAPTYGPALLAALGQAAGDGGTPAAGPASAGITEVAAPAGSAASPGSAGWIDPADPGGPLPAAVLDAVARLRGSPVDREPVAEGTAVPQGASEGTSVVAAADQDGNVVVLVHSNSHPQFGSGLVVDEYDLILSNRAGRGFSATPGHPNAPAPGRRPPTTLHAWALAAGPAPGSEGAAGPDVFGATPGGEQQVAWNAQVIAALLDPATGLSACAAGGNGATGDTGAGAAARTDAAAAAEVLGRVLTGPRWSVSRSGTGLSTEWVDDAVSPVRPAHIVIRSGATRPGRSPQAREAARAAGQPAGGSADVLVAAADPRIGATVMGV